jgi:hypothetical protein
VPHDADHYEPYYADKLWRLLPEVYRAADSVDPDLTGPLEELVERIGVQAAIVRRSLDRLWDDQSIETCDDWLIPYIGDLLATNLVASLDAPGQRLDVARTIYYRRRKGTPALLEELAADVTRWNAHLVEFFRRLSRTRHCLDPEIGLPAETDDPAGNLELQQAELLTGLFTGTPMGGFADLRNVYGASRAGTSYDEFFYTADVRFGRGARGWYGIPKLGVFLWRLYSLSIVDGTPVPCPTVGQYTFDPTGRLAPLFAPAIRTRSSYGDAWVSPKEWQVPGPLTTELLKAVEGMPNENAALLVDVHPVGLTGVTVHPEIGTFHVTVAVPARDLTVNYHYGFPSLIGAGPFDRRQFEPRIATPAPVRPRVTGGSGQLAADLGALAADGSVTIADNLTYDSIADVGTGAEAVHRVTVRALNGTRPLIRLDGTTEWVIKGDANTGDDQELVLDGIFLSGADIVLQGSFRVVRLKCCTLDPGTSGAGEQPPQVFASSVDGRPLRPSRLIVEAHVEQLDVDRCVLGGIRARTEGEIERLTAHDSVLQAIRTSDLAADVPLPFDPLRLFRRLHQRGDPLSKALSGRLVRSAAAVTNFTGALPSVADQQDLVADLHDIVGGGASLYDPALFAGVHLDDEVTKLLGPPLTGDLVRLNRLLLEQAYAIELEDLALALGDGTVVLERCTLLGPAYVHRLEASECILDDTVVVEDLQHGCVRFTAYASDSSLPRKYESVAVAPRAPLFESRDFGRPDYAQLVSTVDQAIVSGTNTIAAGGPRGSELGAYAGELAPIKERSLRIKYDEFMPIGLSPVVVHVT